MTGILSNQLPGRANPPDADNPLGSFKDRTAPGANDGSYLTQTWSNDRDSILQALFIASGLTPNGIEDTGTASQLFDALVNNRWSSIGNYLPGSIVVGSDGNQYKAVSSNGRDSTVVDPVTATNRNDWVQYPYEEVLSGNGTFFINHDDTVMCFIEINDVPGSYPVSFGSITLSSIESKAFHITTTAPSDRFASFVENVSLNGGTVYFDGPAGLANKVNITIWGKL